LEQSQPITSLVLETPPLRDRDLDSPPPPPHVQTTTMQLATPEVGVDIGESEPRRWIVVELAIPFGHRGSHRLEGDEKPNLVHEPTTLVMTSNTKCVKKVDAPKTASIDYDDLIRRLRQYHLIISAFLVGTITIAVIDTTLALTSSNDPPSVYRDPNYFSPAWNDWIGPFAYWLFTWWCWIPISLLWSKENDKRESKPSHTASVHRSPQSHPSPRKATPQRWSETLPLKVEVLCSSGHDKEEDIFVT